MKPVRLTLILCAAFALSLALARAHPFGDARLHSAQSSPSPFMDHAEVPPQVRTVLAQKCADCHSDTTHAPWYTNFAPASWLVEHDVVEGRRHMNLSHWDTLPEDKQQTLAAKIVQQTRTRSMSPIQYRLIHWNARITDADVQTLATWARDSSKSDAAVHSASAQATGADANLGKAVFEKRCFGCHTLDQNREGPRLSGVYGRISGTVPQFAYSDALKKAHITWSDESLDRWLTDPDTLVPGNDMEFGVPRPEERRNLIEFLKQQHAPR